MKVTECEKPKIKKIVFLSGETVTDAILETEAPTLPGFIALQSQEIKNSTEYIAFSAIQSMLIKNEEMTLISPEYYLAPTMTVRIKR